MSSRYRKRLIMRVIIRAASGLLAQKTTGHPQAGLDARKAGACKAGLSWTIWVQTAAPAARPELKPAG